MVYPPNEILFSHKNNEVLIQITLWMTVKNMVLSKSDTEGCIHIVLFHLHEMCRRGKCIKIGSRLVVAEGWSGGTANRYERSFGGLETGLW